MTAMGQKKNNFLHSLKHLVRGERINDGWTEENPPSS